MFLDSSFFVQAGELLRAGPWNAAGRAISAMRLISGIGVRLRTTPDGTFINVQSSNAVFDHPFRVTLVGTDGAKVKPGRINLVPGQIGKDDLEVEEGKETPTLEFKTLRLDKDGRGWIAAEVTCSGDNWAVKSWEIVQVADLDTPDGNVGSSKVSSGSSQGGVPNLPGRRARQPLAMLRQSKSTGNLRLMQITMHHLQHRVKLATQDPNVDAGRHFFFPQG